MVGVEKKITILDDHHILVAVAVAVPIWKVGTDCISKGVMI